MEQSAADTFQLFRPGRAEGQTEFPGVPAQQVEGGLDGNRVHVAEQGAAEFGQFHLQLPGGGEIVLQAKPGQPPHFRREDVGNHRDNPLSAQRADSHGIAIVA